MNIKQISLSVSILLASTGGVMSADCVPSPDCASLGYTFSASACTGASLKCPWDLTKASCQCTVANCATCEDGKPNSCKVCKDGYVRKSSLLYGAYICESENPCSVMNCDICAPNDDKRCLICKSGYSLTPSNTCIAQITVVPMPVGCAKVENEKCTKCIDGYYLTTNGRCLSCEYGVVQNEDRCCTKQEFDDCSWAGSDGLSKACICTGASYAQ